MANIDEVPSWLIGELKRNASFVQEAIANWAGDDIAVAWISDENHLTNAIQLAVEAWIVHWWEYGKQDADHIARTWQKELGTYR